VIKKTKNNQSTLRGTKILAQVQHLEHRLGEKRKPNSNFDSVYYVLNSTCIYMRAEGLNIYIYRRERIYKEPLKKYNNKKIIHTIYCTVKTLSM
jgi:hypothetical protein